MEKLDNFDYVDFDVETFKMSELNEWKKRLSQATTFKHVEIQWRQFIEDDEMAYGYRQLESDDPVYRYDIPNSREAFLCVSKHSGSVAFDRFPSPPIITERRRMRTIDLLVAIRI